MERHVEPLLALELVERRRDLLDRLVAAVERRAEDRHDADRVLVAQCDGLVGSEVEAVALHRHQARLDVPVAAELLPADLDVDAHDQVRSVGRLAGRAHPLAPAPLERQPAEHRGLARAGRRAAGRLLVVGRVPQVRDDVHAARLDLRRLRVLVLVDHVLVGGLGHQPRGQRTASRSSRTSPGSAAPARRAAARSRSARTRSRCPGRCRRSRGSGASPPPPPACARRLPGRAGAGAAWIGASSLLGRRCGTNRSCLRGNAGRRSRQRSGGGWHPSSTRYRANASRSRSG